jgi:hypothetical protein
MGKKDGKQTTAAPQIDQNVVNRIANPPRRGVDSNLSVMVQKKLLTGSVAAQVDGVGDVPAPVSA